MGTQIDNVGRGNQVLGHTKLFQLISRKHFGKSILKPQAWVLGYRLLFKWLGLQLSEKTLWRFPASGNVENACEWLCLQYITTFHPLQTADIKSQWGVSKITLIWYLERHLGTDSRNN